MTPNQRLAQHLRAATAVAQESVVRGKDLTQRQREFLARAGCLIEIMKGWYLLAPPGEIGVSVHFLSFFLKPIDGKLIVEGI